MQTYLQTHPWITFQLNLTNFDYKTWLLLGEAQSKCNHISGVPLLPEVAEYLHQLFLAKGVLATTAIEGNTLSEEQVRQRIAGRLKLPPSKEYLGQEIDNVVDACNVISEGVFSGKLVDLTVAQMQEYNQLILRKLNVDDVIPGQIRDHTVVVGNYRGVPAQECGQLLEQLCNWLNSSFEPSKENIIVFGIIKAIVAHLYFAWIHPFGDGNGRTARLIEFQILLTAGVPSTATQLLSNHYNQTRTEYYRQLNRSSKSGGDILPFIRYALQGFVDGLREQIDIITAQQLQVHWINYIYDVFRNKDGVTAVRQRRLSLDLTGKTDPVPFNQIRHLTPRVAEAYAGKTDKTLQRDLASLEKLELVIKTRAGYRANREKMLAFLPATRLT